MRIQVVDKGDQLIGSKDRLEINHETDIYRVAALWLVNSKGEALIAQRKLTKNNEPGKWGPSVAGTVEEGEDYESNIYKEAQEEIGLTGVQFSEVIKIYNDGPRRYFTQWYIAKVDKDVSDFTPQPEEVEQVAWKLYEELVDDVQRHPENYIPSMIKGVAVLAEGLKA